MAGALPGACFIPTREAHAYVGFLSDSDDNGDGFQDLFFDSVDLLLQVTPPEVRVSVNNAEGTVAVPADGRISVYASVLPGDYQETKAVVYALLVVPGTELVLALNEEEEWDSSIVPYRSNISVSSLATFSLVEDIPASIIPAGEYDFYAGIQLPYDHDCDGVLDFYYGMARVIVENHSPVIESFEAAPAFLPITRVVHTYATQGIFTATATVDDGNGHTVVQSLQVPVNDIPPAEPTNVSAN